MISTLTATARPYRSLLRAISPTRDATPLCNPPQCYRYLRTSSSPSTLETTPVTNSKRSSPGLFSIPGLHRPTDFLKLSKEAIQESNDLRSSLNHDAAPTTATDAVNILYQMDLISQTVCNVIDAAELCRSAHASDEWREAASSAFQELSSYIGTLNGDVHLYGHLANIANANYFHELSEEEQRFVFMLKREFEMDGIHMSDSDRANIQKLHEQVTELETLFLSNITHSTKAFGVEQSDIEEVIPKDVLQANGAIYNSESQVTISAGTPIAQSILSFAQHGGLREQVYRETMTSTEENLEVLEGLRRQRHELAVALGYDSYKERFLQDKMAQTSRNVDDFLRSVQRQTASTFKREMSMISSAKQQIEGNSTVQPWDIKFYVKLLKAQSGVDPTDLVPYLSLSNCLETVQKLVQELFELQMREEKMLPGEGWEDASHLESSAPEEKIRKFGFWDANDQPLGTIYLDLHPRMGKYTHAAHFTVRCGCLKDGRQSNEDYQLPVVALVCNMNSGQASFSSHQEVETLFHEFGHALHSLLSRTKFQHLSGTRAAIDFVETPSHWMEHFAWDPQILPHLARTVEGEPLSQKMIQALTTSRNQFKCLEMQNQIVLSKFDQVMFGSLLPPSADGVSNATQDVWATLHAEAGVPFAEGTHWYTNVGHLVTYGAGYYGYLYSQVFADTIWSKKFKGDVLNPSAGNQIWKKLLIHGGARDPQRMLKELLEGESDVGKFARY